MILKPRIMGGRRRETVKVCSFLKQIRLLWWSGLVFEYALSVSGVLNDTLLERKA
jgi:hypothetical protein